VLQGSERGDAQVRGGRSGGARAGWPGRTHLAAAGRAARGRRSSQKRRLGASGCARFCSAPGKACPAPRQPVIRLCTLHHNRADVTVRSPAALHSHPHPRPGRPAGDAHSRPCCGPTVRRAATALHVQWASLGFPLSQMERKTCDKLDPLRKVGGASKLPVLVAESKRQILGTRVLIGQIWSCSFYLLSEPWA
jgi:hypothetical protein